MRHARAARAGVGLLALIGAAHAGTALMLAFGLTAVVAGSRTTGLLLVALAYPVRALLTWAEQVVAQRTAARATDQLRRSTLAATLRHGPAWVARYGSGRLTAALTTGLDALRPWFAGYLPAVILGAALPPLVVIAMAFVDPASAVITVLTLPLVPVLGALIGWATQARAKQRWDEDARLAGHFLDVVQGLATLRVFGRADRQTRVVAEMTDRHRSATMRVLRVAFLSSTALDLLGTLSVGLIAVGAGLRVAAGDMGLAPALLVILLAPEAYRPLREAAARYHASAAASAVIGDIDEVLASPEPMAAPSSPTARDPRCPAEPAAAPPPPAAQNSRGLAEPTPFTAGRFRTSAEHVAAASLSTVEDGGPVLWTERENRRTALLPSDPPSDWVGEVAAAAKPAVDLGGAIGAGEAGVRLQAYPARGMRVDPGAAPGVRAEGLRVRHPGAGRDALRLDRLVVQGGEIVALRGFSGAGKTTALRVLAGIQDLDAGYAEIDGPEAVYLPQRPTLPHARTVGDVAGIAALRAVGLDRELELDTPLGEHGAGVSAGQRQRLALAATLSRASEAPRVLLLDEPTAHLDAASERRVIAKLRLAADRGCAVLVVAHRPALLAAADRTVLVVNHPEETSAATSPHNTSAAPEPSNTTTPGDTSNATESRHTTAATDQHDTSAGTEPGEIGETGAGEAPKAWLAAAAVVLGCGSWLAGVLLTGAAAWLLVRAATWPPVLTLSAAVVLVRGSAVARPLLRYAERLVSHQVAFARLGARRAAVYAGLVPRVPGARTRRRGELLTRVVDDVDADVDGLLRGWLPALAAAGAAVAGAGVVAAVRPAAAIPVVAGMVVAGVLAPALGNWLEARRERGTEEARAALRDSVVETVDGIEELRGSGALGVPEERSRRLAAREARAAREAGLAAALGHLGWGVAVAGAAWALPPGGGLSREWAAVLLLAVVALAEPVGTLPEAALARRRALAARRRLADLTPAAAPGGQAAVAPSTEEKGVVITGLVAGWDGVALNGLDLELPAGSRTAILGPSGSGKSTLAAVLARFLTPTAGTVTLGGTRIGDIPEDDFRKLVVLVGDETEHVFASTVRENLRLAKVDATDDELRASLHRVGLELELDRRLGTGGSTISGGQRKRLATARALLADPAVLILDEPTEALDAAGAEALMADLLSATSEKARTVLVLTHRTDGLRLAGRVLQIGEIQVGGPSRAGVPEALAGGAAQRQ
ncbi:thiol reductant ABC exporter subunit CydC [Actinoplanes sp. NPDC051470]|uniref:thiol reductant ABC exporter subunit CydC n=1 Tax=Actinoplanes sp. NPDC051470 TaxID=3157224 RepID=UPI00341BFFC5